MFQKDLVFGKKYESELLNHISYDSFQISEGLFKDYDVKIVKDGLAISYECKADRWTHRTGNICIEFMCSNKPSGISTSKADYYAYFIVKGDKYELLICKTEDIRQLIKDKLYTRIHRGGDNKNSEFFLFNKNIFCSQIKCLTFSI